MWNRPLTQIQAQNLYGPLLTDDLIKSGYELNSQRVLSILFRI